MGVGFRELVRKAARPLAGFLLDSNLSNSAGWARFFSPSSRTDWSKEAGKIYDNSIVSIGINFLIENWSQAELVVKRKNSSGIYERDHNHAFPNDWRDCNPFYGSDTLDAGLTLSEIVSGNAYILPLKRQNGSPAFVYLPHIHVRVIGGNGWIDYYEYRPGGSSEAYRIKPEEIIHIRYGIDPENQRLGLSKLAALLRDIATDNLGTTYTAAILKKMGVPGMIFTPKDTARVGPSPNDLRTWKSAYEDTFTGDGAGGMMVVPFPGDVTVPGASPEKLGIDKLRSVPSSRILSSIGLSDIALGLPSESKTYENYDKALESAWRNGLMPMMVRRAKSLTKFAREWYGDPDILVEYDFSKVASLQEDQNLFYQRVGNIYKAGVVKRSEAKAMLGLDYDDSDDVYSTEASLGIDGGAKGIIKMAGKRASERRKLVEASDEPADS